MARMIHRRTPAREQDLRKFQFIYTVRKACAPEGLPKRTDFSPYVAVIGQDKPALSIDDQQICVEGLKHGESYRLLPRK